MGLRGAVYTRGYPLSPSEGEIGEVYAGSSPTYRASLLPLSLSRPFFRLLPELWNPDPRTERSPDFVGVLGVG